jgi:hypothetical protein
MICTIYTHTFTQICIHIHMACSMYNSCNKEVWDGKRGCLGVKFVYKLKEVNEDLNRQHAMFLDGKIQD